MMVEQEIDQVRAEQGVVESDAPRSVCCIRCQFTAEHRRIVEAALTCGWVRTRDGWLCAHCQEG
jgi:hypothetical protein